jgi:hypothetical protein
LSKNFVPIRPVKEYLAKESQKQCVGIEIIPFFCFSFCSPTLCAFFVKLCESVSRRAQRHLYFFFMTFAAFMAPFGALWTRFGRVFVSP